MWLSRHKGLPPAAVVVAWLLVMSAQCADSMDPSTSLDTIEDNVVEEMINARAAKLMDKVIEKFEDHLKDYDKKFEKLLDLPGPRAARLEDSGYWHPYLYNTGVGNREDVVVSGVEVDHRLAGVNVVQIFSINLPGFPVLYKGEDGVGYVAVGGNLERLRLMNNWTLASSGCDCGYGGAQQCACCVPGGCACRVDQGFTGGTCVLCGTEHYACHDAGESVVVGTAAGVRVVSRLGHNLLHPLLAVAHGKTITFYNYTEHGSGLKEVGGLEVGEVVTDFGVGLTYTDHDGAVEDNSFLVVFSKDSSVQQFQEIVLSPLAPALAVGIPQKWHITGHEMQVHHSEGLVLVTVRTDNHLVLYHLKEDLWNRRSMVKVQTQKASFKSWLVFKAGFETFLALVSQHRVAVYRLVEDQFEFVQTLEASRGSSGFDGLVAVDIASCQGAVLVAGRGREVVAYVLQHGFVESTFALVFRSTLNLHLDWSTVGGHSDEDSKVAVVEGGAGGAVVVLQVKGRLLEVEHPMKRVMSLYDRTMHFLQKEHESQVQVAVAANERLQASVAFNTNVRGNITIPGGIIVTGHLVTGSLTATRLVFPGTALAGGVTHLQYLNHLSSRPGEDHSLALLQEISVLEATLSNAVPLSGPNRTIEGQKTIVVSGHINLSTFTATSVTLGETRDGSGALYPLNNTLSAIVRLDETGRVVRGRKTFVVRLTTEELHADFLDDIPVHDLVTTTTRQTIAGAVFANGVSAREVTTGTGGTVAGLDLTRAVLLGQPATLGRVTMNGVEAVAGSVQVLSGLVSGFDLDRLYTRALLVTGGRVAGALHFTGNLVVEDLEADVINGVDLRRLTNEVVFKDEDSVLTGKLQVGQSVTVEGDLSTGLLNGRQFPGDYALKTDSVVFTGEVSFDSVVFGEVLFGPQGVVDGIAPHRLVTRTTEQTITGRKVLSAGIDIEGNLDIVSKILDGVNLDDLFANGGGPQTLPVDFKFNLIFKKAVTLRRIVSNGFVNGLDLANLARDLVYKNEQEVRIRGRRTFLRGLTISNARFSGGFNGVDLDSLVTVDSDLTIGGVLTFVRDVSFQQLVVTRVNNIDLAALFSNALYLNRPNQVITGRKLFLKEISAGSLIVEGRVRGVNPQNYVTKSGNQTFTAPQILNSAHFTSLRVNSIDISQGFRINDLDISELARRRLPLGEPIGHTAVLTVDGAVEVFGTTTVEILNGHNLEQLLSTVVTDDKDFTIEGPVTLESLRVKGSVTTEGSVGGSGISLRNVAANAIQLSGNNQISGRLNFEKIEVRGEVVVQGLVEGVNLRKLHEDAVYTDVQHLQTITGTKIFNAGFTVRGNIITKRTNNVDLSTRLLTRTTDQVVSAAHSFLHISAARNVFLQGLFNNIDIKLLVQRSRLRREVITGDVVFTGSVTVRNIIFRGTLNGIDVTAHLADAVRINGGRVTITGTKTFVENLSFRKLNIGLLNGGNLDHFLSTLVTRTLNHRLTGSVRVLGRVTAPSVFAQHLVVKGTVDGVDLRDFRSKAIFLSGRHTVNSALVFTEGVTVRGNLEVILLNHRHFAQEYLTTSTPQTLSQNFTLSSATVTQVEVHGLVNSLRLPEEQRNTFLAVGGQTVVGLITFSGRLVVQGDVIVSGRVGRGGALVKLGQQAVLLSEETFISGSLRFTSRLTVASLTSSTGVVNGVNVADLYRNIWFVDDDSPLVNTIFFLSSVVLKRGLISHGPVDGLDVGKAYREATAALARFRNISKELEENFEHVCPPIAELYKKLESCMYEGDYLSLQDRFSVSAKPYDSISFFAFGATYLVISYQFECHVDLFVWHAGGFVLRQRREGAGFGRHWLLLQDDPEQVFLVMAAAPLNNSCSATNTTVWKVTPAGLEVSQVLGEGYYLSRGPLTDAAHESFLFVHSVGHTFVYSLHPHERRWTLVSVVPSEVAGVFVHPKYGAYTFLHNDQNSTFVASHVIPGVSRGGANLVFALSVTLTTCLNPTFELKVFREVGNYHQCVAEEALPGYPTDLAVFYAGNRAAGSYMVAVTIHSQPPLIYSFSGEILKFLGKLDAAAGAEWVEHVAVRQDGRHFPQHYLLFDPRPPIVDHYTTPLDIIPPVTRDYPNTTTSNTYATHRPETSYLTSGPTTYIVTIFGLQMRGSALPAANLTCTRA